LEISTEGIEHLKLIILFYTQGCKKFSCKMQTILGVIKKISGVITEDKTKEGCTD